MMNEAETRAGEAWGQINFNLDTPRWKHASQGCNSSPLCPKKHMKRLSHENQTSLF
jgi:hypothetical protein